jgi:hypothetical protein
MIMFDLVKKEIMVMFDLVKKGKDLEGMEEV